MRSTSKFFLSIVRYMFSVKQRSGSKSLASILRLNPAPSNENKQEKNNQHLFFHHDLYLHLNEKDQFLSIYLQSV